ncbi:DUF637 domain-containing protein, partial [Pseudomonas citronellolis]|uniref:DUF637 domain-containing protein n=1 Tax=Pseudomonas citronellolis TaxID=53408 RepID=UPI0023E3E91A
VVARTGQRFLDGLTSDEALFKYLMDNAIAYKDSLNLSLGVALSAEQVAALTHDIVWLQDQVVNGEHVLVPVLYLAQANNRLAPNGALIQGQDVSLISGGTLSNQGTLRASHDLSATATNITNSGLLEANRRLQLLATDSIRNAQGGVIKGRDLSLTALTGDLSNERSVTRIDSAQGTRSWTASFADSAARIEADNDLSINAGRDINNIGGTLKAGNDLSLSADRDINLNAAQTTNGQVNGSRHRDQQIEQLGGEVSAGRDLDVTAKRDLSVVASALDAGRDAALSAGRDVTLSSAANESHSYSKTKKITAQQDHVEQQGTTLTAGGDVTVSAGENLTLKASKIGAGNEAYLVAGDKLELLADYDSDYSLYDKKSKGSFGSKKTQRDEVTDVKAIGSQISAGSDLTLLSGGDQKYQDATLESGHDIALVSGGAVTFEAVKDLHQESHEKSSSNLAWQSAKGKGQTDETLRQSQLVAQGELAIRAVDGLNIDLKQIDRKNVSQTIDAMVQADPNLAWLKDAEARGDVDWRRVKEVHDSFKYSNSGMGPAAQLAVAIVVSVMTYGAASAAIGAGATAGSAMSAGVAATATTDAVAAGWANVALASASSSLASTGAVSTINNKGDLGAALKDTLSSDSLRQAMIAGAVGGLTTGYFDDLAGTKTKFVDGKVVVDLSSANGVASFAANQALQNLTSAALNKATGGPANFGDALKDSLYNTLAAAGFNAVGDFGQAHKLETGSGQMVVLHALMGGLAAEARGESFSTGAVAAGLNEAAVKDLDALVSSYSPENREALLSMSSQLLGLVATVAQDPTADAGKLETSSWVAKNSTQYNFLAHELDGLEKEASECTTTKTCDQVREKYRQLSVANDDSLAAACTASKGACLREYGYLVTERLSIQRKLEEMYANDAIPLAFKEDLHRYNLQNVGAMGQLVEASAAMNLQDKGASAAQASWGASLLAALAGAKLGDGAKGAGPKVPPKLLPLSNPPQGPVIPSSWVSRPGKTPVKRQEVRFTIHQAPTQMLQAVHIFG